MEKMETNEMIERVMCGDVRIFNAIQTARITDKSFTDRGFLGITKKYSQSECREIWFKAMALGMLEGLRISTIEGQRIDIFNNSKEPRHIEFLEKFYKLAEEYNCAIVYHPHIGMVVTDLKKINSQTNAKLKSKLKYNR
jgi:hypothetical protein